MLKINSKKQGCRTARLAPKDMTWDLCKIYLNIWMVFWLDSITESEIYISQRISQTGLNASIYTGLRAQKISGKEWEGWITLWMLASSAVLISLIRFGLDDNHFRFCQCYELYSNQHHSVSGNSRWRGVYYFHIFSPSSADCFKTKIFREVRSTDRSAHPSIHPKGNGDNDYMINWPYFCVGTIIKINSNQ